MDRMTVSPTADFLTYCCREADARNSEGVLLRASRVHDWENIVGLAGKQGVTLLLLPLWTDLAERGIMPAFVATQAQGMAYAQAAKLMRLRVALKQVLSGFVESKLQVMVLKGAALASLCYDGAFLRPSGDIDLLCREEEFEKVREVLFSQGFCMQEEGPLPRRCTTLEAYYERHFVHRSGMARIDLHLDCITLGMKPRNTEALWGRAMQLRIDGASALALSPEHQVLMLSVHLHRHGFSRLIWFKDIDLIMRRFQRDIDWDEVARTARAEGAASTLWYTGHFLQRMLGTPVPREIASGLRPSLPTRWVFARIWPEDVVLNLQGRTRRRAVQFNVEESWRGMVPSLVLMGRRREKMKVLLRWMLPFRGSRSTGVG